MVSLAGEGLAETKRDPALRTVGSGATYVLDAPINDGITRERADTLYGIDAQGEAKKLAEGDSFFLRSAGDVVVALESPHLEGLTPRPKMKLFAGAIP